MDEKLRQDIEAGRHVKVPPLARAANMAPATLYYAIARGDVRCVRIGPMVRVPAQEARRLLCLEPAAA